MNNSRNSEVFPPPHGASQEVERSWTQMHVDIPQDLIAGAVGQTDVLQLDHAADPSMPNLIASPMNLFQPAVSPCYLTCADLRQRMLFSSTLNPPAADSGTWTQAHSNIVRPRPITSARPQPL